MPLARSLPLPLFLLGLLCLPSTTAAERTAIFWQTRGLNDLFFSEGADVGDFNRDGEMDIVSGPKWYEGPDFTKSHDYYPPVPFDPHVYSDNFFAFTEDFNDDGWTDILIYGFPGKDASWFENPQGRETLWPRHQVLDVVDNESPMFVDVTGDGRRDIVCSSGGYFGFAEVNRDDPAQPWTFRRISDKTAGDRFTHGLGVGDVNGDGRMDILEKSGWWEQPASLDGDPQWKKHPFPFSKGGGSQMFAYDVDGDGDNDVITSLAAHGYGLAWYEQVQGPSGEITFKRHDILGEHPEDNPYGVCFSQLHAVDLADIDGDGLKDIVTGKRWWAHGPHGDAEPNKAPVLYWLQLQRNAEEGEGSEEGEANGVQFIPHLIHDNSGVGVEVKARDVNGDGVLDVIVGNKRGTFVHVQCGETVSEEEWQRRQPRPASQAAQARSTGLPPTDGMTPEEAAAAMTLPEGFKVQLAAGEPLVHQPVAFTIDERGRLWVAEAYTYPVRAPEGKGRDRIIILEDQDKDGTLETRKVFIEGLNLVSGLEVGFGGVYVGAAPYLMFIPDRDRDDVPDAPSAETPKDAAAYQKSLQFPKDVPPDATVLLDGWGYEDTHETLNSFLWGPDGWLYGCHGVFTHSKIGPPGTPEQDRTPLNAGVWRYHPVRREFEVFAHGTSNPWGLDFNDYGQAFIEACVIPHMYHVIQGGRYQRQAGAHFNPHTYDDIQTIADHAHYAGSIREHAWWGRDQPAGSNGTHEAGGGHAHAGAMIYLGDNWPAEYRNTIFMNNIHGNRVNNDLLIREGSGYVCSHSHDFLFANDGWFRGINLRYGPDGSVYLIDWYDKNACHRRTPEIWDRTNGRIYRISYGDVKPPEVDLAKLSDDELAEFHAHPNDWCVRTARRLLQERAELNRQKPTAAKSRTLSQAEQGLRDLALKGTNVARRLRAAWCYHAMHGTDWGLTKELLFAHGADAEYLRAWAVQLELEDSNLPTGLAADVTAISRTEPSAIVRLAIAAGLQRIPLSQRWIIAENLLANPDDANDHNIPLMIWYGVEPLVPVDPERALALAANSKVPLVSQFIYRRAAADDVAINALLTAMTKAESDERVKLMLDEIANSVRTRGRTAMPKAWPDAYAKLSKSASETIREQAQFITVKFGDRSIFPALREIAADSDASAESRRRAVEALLSGKDDQLPPVLEKLVDDPALRSAALRGLAAYEVATTPQAILSRYGQFTEEEKADAIATLASRATYALPLLDAIEAGAVPRGDLKAFTVVQLQQLKDDTLLARLNQVWGTIRSTPEEKQQQIAEMKRKLAPALANADTSHGRELFVKTCAKCHKLFGEGGTIGPDITGSNRTNLDYLLQNILDPSAVVGKDYQTTLIITLDGRVLNGIVKEENDTAVVLQTANEQLVVEKSNVDERKLAETSLMPEGQLKDMPGMDIRDLLGYLASPTQVSLPGEGPTLNAETGAVPGALEGERLKVLSVSKGKTRSQSMGTFSKGRWSGAGQLWWTGGGRGDRLVLEVPVKTAGRYEVFAVMTRARDYGVVQLSLDDCAIGNPIDLFNFPDVAPTPAVSLGVHDLAAGTHKLQVEIVGENPNAEPARMFGLDYLYLAPRATAGEQAAAR